MSLFKLLATGKSLIGMKDKNSPYRMRTANLLPKFDSPKNPFAQPKIEKPKAASANGVAVQASQLETNLIFDEPAKVAKVEVVAVAPVEPVEAVKPKIAEVKFEPEMAKPKACAPVVKPLTPVMPEAPRVNPAMAPVGQPAKPSSLAEWAKKVNPLKYLPARDAGGTKSKGLRTAVQTELSLDNVKVVCNDLSDTDLEIVAPRPAAKPAVTTATAKAPPEKAAADNFDRVTSRFFGAEMPQT